MSVVNGKFIFCEGKEKSYDRALINRILDGISGVTIVPSGGKFNFSGFIDGYLDSQSNIRALVSSNWRLESLQYKRFNKAGEFGVSPPKLTLFQ